MRYVAGCILLFGAMLSDILLIGATAVVIAWNIANPDLGFALLSGALIIGCYSQWAKTGGFDNWKISTIREFFKRMEE